VNKNSDLMSSDASYIYGVSSKEKTVLNLPSAVNHPPHYGGADNPYEVIKIEEALGLTTNHYRCTALEYMLRAGKKDPSKLVEDLEKSVWWLQREIAALKRLQK